MQFEDCGEVVFIQVVANWGSSALWNALPIYWVEGHDPWRKIQDDTNNITHVYHDNGVLQLWTYMRSYTESIIDK